MHHQSLQKHLGDLAAGADERAVAEVLANVLQSDRPLQFARARGCADRRARRWRFRRRGLRDAASSCGRTRSSLQPHPGVGGGGDIGDDRRQIDDARAAGPQSAAASTVVGRLLLRRELAGGGLSARLSGGGGGGFIAVSATPAPAAMSVTTQPLDDRRHQRGLLLARLRPAIRRRPWRSASAVRRV